MKEDQKLLTRIKVRHYLWCLKNGRDTKWYEQIKKQRKKFTKEIQAQEL